MARGEQTKRSGGEISRPGQQAEGQREATGQRETKREGSREQEGLTRRQAYPTATHSPFSFMRRFSEEMDRLFEDFGFGGSLFSPSTSALGGELPVREFGRALWTPQIEMFERGNELVVRADLPGISKENLKVEFADGALTIQGERKHEEEKRREGRFHSERSYGSFLRTIPLPEGVDPDEAKATFRDGVLEIVMKAPEHERARRIEIKE